MTDTTIQKAKTVHGDVEYETVRCDSCDNELMKEDAYRFVTIDPSRLKKDKSWSDHHEWEVYDGGYNDGWACEHCHQNGPIGFPRIRSAVEFFNELYESVILDDLQMLRFGVAIYLVLTTTLSAVVVVAVIMG